jgi:two-component system sensor histidine kinase CpxA
MKIRVRSIFTKIVLWSFATVALSWIGFVFTSALLSARFAGRDSFLSRMNAIFLDDARHAYEAGGKPQLDAYLKRLETYSDAEFFLTDSHGTDLVTGEDRSGYRPRRPRPYRSLFWRFLPAGGPFVRIRVSDDGQYRLITALPPPPRLGAWDSLLYFLWLPLLIAVLCYLLAVHLAAPLRALRRVVERFGRGDLSARMHLLRQDEIGELARAFNLMAAQITTLLSAERRLLQDVSHELRSPLARLGFAVELARTNADREAALDRIRKEAGRLSQLVDELLHLTRAEGDPTARNLEPVKLDALLGDLVADCNLEAEAQGCRLVLRIKEPALVTGERELLRRACDNVLRNAIRHAPAESTIEIGLSVTQARATISFRDHGPGVPQELLGEIFNPFYRVENDRDRSSGGVGLGLAIARRAVELHQGRITGRNSSPGLIVEIELPVDSLNADA